MNRIEAFDARGLGVKLLLAAPNKSSKNGVEPTSGRRYWPDMTA
jgi:hypothetical protein